MPLPCTPVAKSSVAMPARKIEYRRESTRLLPWNLGSADMRVAAVHASEPKLYSPPVCVARVANQHRRRNFDRNREEGTYRT
jgi:hypothetical protein